MRTANAKWMHAFEHHKIDHFCPLCDETLNVCGSSLSLLHCPKSLHHVLNVSHAYNECCCRRWGCTHNAWSIFGKYIFSDTFFSLWTIFVSLVRCTSDTLWWTLLIRLNSLVLISLECVLLQSRNQMAIRKLCELSEVENVVLDGVTFNVSENISGVMEVIFDRFAVWQQRLFSWSIYWIVARLAA